MFLYEHGHCGLPYGYPTCIILLTQILAKALNPPLEIVPKTALFIPV